MPSTATKATKRKSIKIESGVPLPPYTKMLGAPKNSLFEDLKKMKPLESRFIDTDYSKENLNRIRTQIHGLVKKMEEGGDTGRRYTVNVDPKEGKKLRVWRVE